MNKPVFRFAPSPNGELHLGHAMFVAMEDTTELNPFSKHGIFLLLHTSWKGRALHMSS